MNTDNSSDATDINYAWHLSAILEGLNTRFQVQQSETSSDPVVRVLAASLMERVDDMIKLRPFVKEGVTSSEGAPTDGFTLNIKAFEPDLTPCDELEACQVSRTLRMSWFSYRAKVWLGIDKVLRSANIGEGSDDTFLSRAQMLRIGLNAIIGSNWTYDVAIDLLKTLLPGLLVEVDLICNNGSPVRLSSEELEKFLEDNSHKPP